MPARSPVLKRSRAGILAVACVLLVLGLPLLTGADPPPNPGGTTLDYCHGHFVANLDVPGPGEHVSAAIDLRDCAAPPGATVSRISMEANFETDFQGTAQCFDCLGQVDVWLANAAHQTYIHAMDQRCCGQALAEQWSQPDSTTCACELTAPNVTSFNGDPVHGKWFILAEKGCASSSNYRLVEWEITVYYQTPPAGTPTPTPTPTATPRPFEGCENILPNGGFESGILAPWWTTGAARVNSQYKHDGTKSVLLVEANDQDGELIASLRLPENVDSITLRYWWRVQTQDPEPHTDSLNVLVEPGTASHQVAYHAADDSPGRWNLGEIDLTAYAGEETIILFQGHNGPTYPSKWYVDQVEVEVCGPGWGGYRLFVPLVLR